MKSVSYFYVLFILSVLSTLSLYLWIVSFLLFSSLVFLTSSLLSLLPCFSSPYSHLSISFCSPSVARRSSLFVIYICNVFKLFRGLSSVVYLSICRSVCLFACLCLFIKSVTLLTLFRTFLITDVFSFLLFLYLPLRHLNYFLYLQFSTCSCLPGHHLITVFCSPSLTFILSFVTSSVFTCISYLVVFTFKSSLIHFHLLNFPILLTLLFILSLYVFTCISYLAMLTFQLPPLLYFHLSTSLFYLPYYFYYLIYIYLYFLPGYVCLSITTITSLPFTFLPPPYLS